MIQTKIPIMYGARNEREGILKIEAKPIDVSKEGTKYLVIDRDIANINDAWFSKEVFWDAEKIDQVNDYLEANHDFSQLTKTETEWKKIQLALMLDTQTNLLESGKTIYGLNPSDWEFSEL